MANTVQKVVGLSKVKVGDGFREYEFLMSQTEEVLLEYKSIRDRFIVTNEKLIMIDTQGITGRKKEYLSIYISSISSFSVESSGTFDMDAELKVYASGIGQMEFEFLKGTDVRELASAINNSKVH